MIIRNIECSELKLSKSSVFFKAELTGKDYRYMKAMSAKIVEIDVENENVKNVNVAKYFEGLIEFFPLIAVVVKEEEKEIEPTLDWYDALPYEDADAIYNFIFNFVNKKK